MFDLYIFILYIYIQIDRQRYRQRLIQSLKKNSIHRGNTHNPFKNRKNLHMGQFQIKPPLATVVLFTSKSSNMPTIPRNRIQQDTHKITAKDEQYQQIINNSSEQSTNKLNNHPKNQIQKKKTSKSAVQNSQAQICSHLSVISFSHRSSLLEGFQRLIGRLQRTKGILPQGTQSHCAQGCRLTCRERHGGGDSEVCPGIVENMGVEKSWEIWMK